MKTNRIAMSAVAVVATVAAVISFEHMRQLAESAGEDWKSWLTPLSVDGMLVASSLAARQAKAEGRKVPRLTVFSIGIGIGISVAANILSSFSPEDLPVWLPGAIAAWPPLALALAFEEALKLKGTAPAVPMELPEPEQTPQVEEPIAPEPARPEPADPDAAARAAARDLIRSGVKMSGKVLGQKFAKSDRWGRVQIEAVRQEQGQPVPAGQ